MNTERERFKDRELFVPMNIRDSSLTVKRGKNIDTTVTVTLVLVGLAIGFFLLTAKSFMDITGFNFMITLCTYIFALTAIIYYITAKFIFKIDAKMKARAMQGSEIFDINLGKVWRIRAGGISTKTITSGECVLLNYDGRPAIVFKRINTSIEGTFEEADAAHYKGLQKATDTLVSFSSAISKLNIRYNTKNDNVWDYESRRLYHSDHGDTYVQVMKEIIEHRYMFTEKFSNVSSKYYIVLCKPNTTLTEINNLYETVKRHLTFTCSSPSLVKLEELQYLMVQYYGLNNIDLNNMVPITSNAETIGESKILDFVKPDGTIDVSKLPHLKIPDLNVYQSLVPSASMNNFEEEKPVDIIDIIGNDIFNQDYM